MLLAMIASKDEEKEKLAGNAESKKIRGSKSYGLEILQKGIFMSSVSTSTAKLAKSAEVISKTRDGLP